MTKKDVIRTLSEWFQVPQSVLEDANSQRGNWEIPGYELIKVSKVEPAEKVIKIYQQIDECFVYLNQDTKDDWLIYLPVSHSMNTKQPYDSTLCYQHVHWLCETYPFIQKRIIGYSLLKKPIFELRVGRGKKKVQMNASFHANEWVTSALLMSAFYEYVCALSKGELLLERDVLKMYEEVELSIVPMVNPDGVDLVIHGSKEAKQYEDYVIELNQGAPIFSHWKANIRGIDLNNQFPSFFKIEQKRKPKKPGPRDFPGFFPLSEPEAKVMAHLVNKEMFDRLICFHSQGEEFYYGYLGFEPEESKPFAKSLEEASGYKAIRYIDSYAGFRDWFIHTQGQIGVTVEIGKGENPLSLEKYDKMAKETLALFLTSLDDF